MNPFKKYAIFAGIGLALVVGGYAAGRYAAPDKVVVTEKVVTVHDVQVVKTVDTDAVIAAIKDVQAQQVTHKVTTKVKKPDGTVTQVTTTDTDTKTDTNVKVNTEVKTQEATKTNDHTETQVTLTKTVERDRPAWRLTLSPGLDIAEALGHNQGTPYSLIPPNNAALKYLVLGVGLEHRLVGPISGGVWANSRGAGGLSLSLEW